MKSDLPKPSTHQLRNLFCFIYTLLKCRGILYIACVISWISLLCSLSLSAQPSGGPYGPVRQNYELPNTSGKIYYVSPDGSASASGEEFSQPTTIESAIERVRTGDAVVMRGGIYRTGNLILNQGIDRKSVV